MIDRWGASRPNGGVTILVDKRLNTTGWVAEAGTSAQVLGVWVENWFIASFYAPPPAVGARLDPAVEACELLNSMHLATGCLDVEKWLLAGDANSTADQSPLAELIMAYGCRTLSQGQPTDSRKLIGWLLIVLMTLSLLLTSFPCMSLITFLLGLTFPPANTLLPRDS